MCRGVRHPARPLFRRPRRPDLDLCVGLAGGQPAEEVRGGPRHRSARLAVGHLTGLQRTGQPRPGHLRQQRIGAHLRLQLGPRQRHHPERALPGVVPGRVVQQHQPPVRQFRRLAVRIRLRGDDRRLQGVCVRGEPSGRGRRIDLDLRPQPCRAKRLHRLTEGDRGLVRAVREVFLSRSHARKIRRNEALIRGGHPLRASPIRRCALARRWASATSRRGKGALMRRFGV